MGLGGLGIDGHVLVIMLINFILLFVLLGWVLYKPVLNMLDERSDTIRESMDQAEHIKQEAARAEDTVREQIETGRKEGQAIVAQASQIAEQVKEEARLKAREEAESLIAKARIEIDRERVESMEELRREFVDLAIAAAEKVVEKTIDENVHRKLIEQVLEESNN